MIAANTVVIPTAAWLLLAACQGALPPDAIDAMLSNADEVLLLRVESLGEEEIVDGDGEYGNCFPHYKVNAKLLGVNQTTTTGLTDSNIGQSITFSSYYRDETSGTCQAWVGPIPPEKLQVGWCGYVHFNHGDEQEEEGGDTATMNLAAYGNSFVPVSEEVCQQAAAKAKAAAAAAGAEGSESQAQSDGSESQAQSDGDGEVSDPTPLETSQARTRASAFIMTSVLGALIGFYNMI